MTPKLKLTYELKIIFEKESTWPMKVIHSCVGIHIILSEHNNGSWSYKKLIYKVCLNGTICENIT